MSGFICMKTMTLSGIEYVPGDVIPAEAVLPSRVLALKRNGCIVDAPEEGDSTEKHNSAHTGDIGENHIEIPIHTSEGLTTVTVSSQSVSRAFQIIQLSEKDAKEAIANVDDDDTLMLIDCADRRRAVMSAVRKRHEMIADMTGDVLETEDGDADGKDI